ncbi:MAG: gyrase subunit, partial [Patescibacteria group bacterium]|nr:gyrase subunit [Patescibacteria group bacterium]
VKAQAGLSLVLITEQGVGKKMSADSFKDVRRSGLIAIRLDKDDALKSALLVEKGDDVLLGSNNGQSIRFKESDIREMGRSAGGVRAISLGKGDSVVSVDAIRKGDNDGSFLVMSENGLGKKTSIKEYKVQKRGGSGVLTAKITPKTGKLIIGKIVKSEGEGEMVAISKKGQVIRVELSAIPSLGRQTQGVTVMKLRAGDTIASLTIL